jgi:hypothetical protein
MKKISLTCISARKAIWKAPATTLQTRSKCNINKVNYFDNNFIIIEYLYDY